MGEIIEQDGEEEDDTDDQEDKDLSSTGAW